jgi:membrane-associated phospholipid phosphatase
MNSTSIKSLVILWMIIPFCAPAQTSGSDSLVNRTEAPTETQMADPQPAPDMDAALIPKKDSVKHLYRVNYWVSIPFCVVASAADIYAIPEVIKSKKAITTQELAGLNKNVFNDLDRFALHQDPTKREMYQKASDYGLPLLIVTPGLLAFNKNIRKDWFRILVMYYEMHAITFSIYNYSFFGPAFQNKYRPLVYYDQLPNYIRTPGNNRNSMYSGHEATAIASTYFMVKIYSDYHPEIGQKKYLLYAIATVPPLIEGYLRVKGLEHFPSDVLVGLAIGAACGVLVPEIHRFKNHKVEFGVTGSPVGMGGAGVNMLWHI